MPSNILHLSVLFGGLVSFSQAAAFPTPSITLASGLLARAPVPTPPPPAAPQPACHPYQDPHNGVAGYCQCANDVHVIFDKGPNPCPWTIGQVIPASITIPPSLTPSDVAINNENNDIKQHCLDGSSHDPKCDLIRQQDADKKTFCSDGTQVNATCWQVLELTNYARQWWGDNKDQCQRYSGFAECWYAKKTRYAPSACNQTNEETACDKPQWLDFAPNGIQDFYVTWVIWNTHGLIGQLGAEIEGATEKVSLQLGRVIDILSPPPDKVSHVAEYILDALTFGLSLYAEGSTLIKGLIRVAPQSTTLGSKLYPKDPEPKEIADYRDQNEVNSVIGEVTEMWAKSVNQSLPILVNDVNQLTTFADNSPIAGLLPPKDDSLSGSMATTVATLATSVIINELNLVVARAADTDVHALQTNGTALRWDTGCGAGYDKSGICDSFFFDGHDTYSLIDPAHSFDNTNSKLSAIIGEGGLTTGPLLFTNGFQCGATCGKNGGCPPQFDPLHPDTMMCVSQLRVCTWTRDSYGPFQQGCDASVLPDFGVKGCGPGFAPLDKKIANVPHAYLGGGILSESIAPKPWDGYVTCNQDIMAEQQW